MDLELKVFIIRLTRLIDFKKVYKEIYKFKSDERQCRGKYLLNNKPIDVVLAREVCSWLTGKVIRFCGLDSELPVHKPVFYCI